MKAIWTRYDKKDHSVFLIDEKSPEIANRKCRLPSGHRQTLRLFAGTERNWLGCPTTPAMLTLRLRLVSILTKLS